MHYWKSASLFPDLCTYPVFITFRRQLPTNWSNYVCSNYKKKQTTKKPKKSCVLLYLKKMNIAVKKEHTVLSATYGNYTVEAL